MYVVHTLRGFHGSGELGEVTRGPKPCHPLGGMTDYFLKLL